MYNACHGFSLGQENDRAVRVQEIPENGNRRYQRLCFRHIMLRYSQIKYIQLLKSLYNNLIFQQGR
jgi:hypothetical protein